MRCGDHETDPPPSIWAVFEHGHFFWRHCLVIGKQNGVWWTVDPLANGTCVEIETMPGDWDYPQWWRGMGYDVIPATKRETRFLLPFPCTCVETVKRILGIGAPWIVTPGQLRRRLLRDLRNDRFVQPAATAN